MRRLLILAVLQAVAIQSSYAQQRGTAPGAGHDPHPIQLLAFGAPVQRPLHSGDVDEYLLNVSAGDLVSGRVEVTGLAVLLEVLDTAGAVVHTNYSFQAPQPVSIRVGFVAATTGKHRLRVRAFDRFGGGPQWAPGEPVPIVGSASGNYTLALDDVPVAIRMAGVNPPVREDYPSARLRRLAQDVQRGQRDAVESFWREVEGKGPLVEEIAGNDRDFDVTFLWREIYDTRNVLLDWCPRSDDCYMSHLPRTDIWYKTVRIRRGTRIAYAISPNDRTQDRWATRQLDSMNPRKFPDDPTYRFISDSVLDTAGAPDEQWALRKPFRRGAIEQRRIASAILGGERDIWIYTPPGYTRTDGPYPLLLLLDGAAYVSNRFLNAPATLDNLINDARIRPVIVCFDPANRGNAVPVPGTESKYSRVVAEELVPMLRAAYPISAKPAEAVIGGFSAGGRAAAEIAFLHPDMFGNVLSYSGSFCDCGQRRAPGSYEPNSSAQAYLAAPRKAIRFYLEVGLYDSVPNAELPVHELVLEETNLSGNRHLRDVLRAKEYDVTYREVGGGHDFVHWRAMLADGLMVLLHN